MCEESRMAIRTTKKGKGKSNKGKEGAEKRLFWGCMNFPSCRGSKNYKGDRH